MDTSTVRLMRGFQLHVCLLPPQVCSIWINRPGPARDSAADWQLKPHRLISSYSAFYRTDAHVFILKQSTFLRETQVILSLITIPTAAELSGRNRCASKQTTVTRSRPGRLSCVLGGQARPQVLEGSSPPSGAVRHVCEECTVAQAWVAWHTHIHAHDEPHTLVHTHTR